MESLLKEPRWAIRAASAVFAILLLFILGLVEERHGDLRVNTDQVVLVALGLYTATRWAIVLLCVAIVANTRRLVDEQGKFTDTTAHKWTASTGEGEERPHDSSLSRETEFLENFEATRDTVNAALERGARNAREAAGISVGRPLTDEEWERHKEPWEQVWAEITA